MTTRWQRLWAHLSNRQTPFVRSYPRHVAWRLLEAILLLFDWLYLPEILLTVHQWCKPRTRRLSVSEFELARSIFGAHIDYQKVRIDEQARIGCRIHHFAYVSFQLINTWGPLSEPHFIHELVHVWQYQRLGSVYIPRALYAQRTPEGYNYGGIAGLRRATEQGRGLEDFNFEQQGDVVADYFCLRNGYSPRWCPNDPVYLTDFERVLEGGIYSVVKGSGTAE